MTLATPTAHEPHAGRHARTTSAVTAARAAQSTWQLVTVRERLAVLRRIRRAIADRVEQFTAALAIVPGRGDAESIAAEILPLADAIRFLERTAVRALKPSRPTSRLRPAWLIGCDLAVLREPLGVVLIVAPANYPLLLAGVQAMQALAAGNAVLVKPSPAGGEALSVLKRVAADSGLPPGLLTVLDTHSEHVYQALPSVDHVVFTGSLDNGRAIASAAAEQLVPATLELSGYDAFFILPGADLNLAARALAFGMRFNAGASCIAPHRVFVSRDNLGELEERLKGLARSLPRPAARSATRAGELAEQAIRLGAVPLDDTHPPRILSRVCSDAAVMTEEFFGPLAAICPVATMDDALAHAARCRFALGATIIGPDAAARAFALRVNAGCVVINDCLAPTADPRLPFAPRGDSGYGVTRGADGLLAMTRVKAVARRRGTFRPHFEPMHKGDAAAFAAYVRAAHGSGTFSRIGQALCLAKGLIGRGGRVE